MYINLLFLEKHSVKWNYSSLLFTVKFEKLTNLLISYSPWLLANRNSRKYVRCSQILHHELSHCVASLIVSLCTPYLWFCAKNKLCLINKNYTKT